VPFRNSDIFLAQFLNLLISQFNDVRRDELFVDVEQSDSANVLWNFRSVRYRNKFRVGGARYMRPFRRARRHIGSRLLPHQQEHRRRRALRRGWNMDRWYSLGLVLHSAAHGMSRITNNVQDRIFERIANKKQ